MRTSMPGAGARCGPSQPTGQAAATDWKPGTAACVQTTTPAPCESRDERLPTTVSQAGPSLPRVVYHPSPTLTQDEAGRRVGLAYAYLLGLVPWPCESGLARSGAGTPVP